MTVGTLQVRLHLRNARSLKDKRHVLRGLKDRIRSRFNVSIAEVGDQDIWKSSTLGVAAVGTDRQYVDGLLAQVVNFIQANPGAELVDYNTELF